MRFQKWRKCLYPVTLMVIAGLFSCCLSAQDHTASMAAQAQAQTQTSGSNSDSSSSAQTSQDDEWHFALSPYIWFAGTHGTVGVHGHDVSMHASPGDLLSHFNFGLMGAAEARFERIVLNGDMIWIRLSDSRAIPFPGLSAVSADVRIGQFVWTSKIGYRLIDHGIKGDATVGVRYWHLGQKLDFNPSILGINFNGSQDWADVVVGGRLQFPVAKDKAVINLLGDVGGWNATAKLDYQFAALLGYKVSPKWTVQAGYRYLFIDYRNGFNVMNNVTSGAVIGLTFNLK